MFLIHLVLFDLTRYVAVNYVRVIAEYFLGRTRIKQRGDFKKKNAAISLIKVYRLSKADL